MGTASRQAKVRDREPARMHPEDARARGLSDADVVRVHNDRGSALAGLRIDSAVRPGVIQMSTGAWYDPQLDESGARLEVHGNPNVLTADSGTSRLAQGPSAHSALVEVVAHHGRLPALAVSRPPPLVTGRDSEPDTEPTEGES